jgi:hypothetical protein
MSYVIVRQCGHDPLFFTGKVQVSNPSGNGSSISCAGSFNASGALIFGDEGDAERVCAWLNHGRCGLAEWLVAPWYVDIAQEVVEGRAA